MVVRSGRMVLSAAATLVVVALAPAVQAEEFFSSLFGAFGAHRQQAPMTPLPFANDGNGPAVPDFNAPRARVYTYSGGSQAYCVRTCDGRYFPITATGNQTKAASCSSLCPASDTKVVYGSNIDNAATESGRPYSELPNAFRYRNELVAGCSCNGKDPTGLAAVKVEDDPTLRKGDIVVGGGWLMVAGRGADRRGASLNLSPAPAAVRSHYRHVPVVASE
jgi:hypothetical protein